MECKRHHGTPQRQNGKYVAAWLEITPEEAIRLQGGTAEELHAASARKAGAANKARKGSKKWQEHARRGLVAAREALRGKERSPQHRLRLSAAAKALRDRPGGHASDQWQGTVHGQARHILSALRWRRPGLSEEELKLWYDGEIFPK